MSHEIDPHSEHMSRRDCLVWLARAGALAVVAGSGMGQCFAEDAPGGMVKIADLKDLKLATAYPITKPNVILTRTKDGLACFTTRCTHKGGILGLDKSGVITCPKHGATFDLTGKPTKGPAKSDLTWYQLDLDKDGKISVDVSKTVAQGKWTAVPADKK